MAGPGVCDGCGERPVMFMVTQVDTGETNGWCVFCFLTSAQTLGELLIEQGVIPAPEEPAPKSRRRRSGPESTAVTEGPAPADPDSNGADGSGSDAEAEATEPAAALDG